MTTAPVTFPNLTNPTSRPARPVQGLRASGLGIVPGALASAGAVIGALVAVVTIALAHLAARSVDPVAQTLSMYAVTPASGGLFAIACTALALGTVALGRSLPRLGAAAAYAAGVMLVLVVVFPTDVGDGPLSASAQIHRYAAGAAFVLLAIAMVTAVRGCAGARRIALLSLLAIVAVALLLTVAATFAPDVLAMAQWRGIPQRALMLCEAGAVALLGMRAPGARTRAREIGVRHIQVNPAR